MRFSCGEADAIRDQLRIDFGVSVDDREREWRTGGQRGGGGGGRDRDRGGGRDRGGRRERDERGYSRVGGAGPVDEPSGDGLDVATVEQRVRAPRGTPRRLLVVL